MNGFLCFGKFITNISQVQFVLDQHRYKRPNIGFGNGFALPLLLLDCSQTPIVLIEHNNRAM